MFIWVLTSNGLWYLFLQENPHDELLFLFLFGKSCVVWVIIIMVLCFCGRMDFCGPVEPLVWTLSLVAWKFIIDTFPCSAYIVQHFLLWLSGWTAVVVVSVYYDSDLQNFIVTIMVLDLLLILLIGICFHSLLFFKHQSSCLYDTVSKIQVPTR